jgi:zeaxanthin glucosyltransferase
MATVLFILMPLPSHYYSTFGMARYLQNSGAKIIYSGTPICQSLIETEGFIFKPLRYMEEFTIKSLKVALGLTLKNLIDPTYVKHRYKEFLLEIQAVNALIKSVKPEVIFLEDMVSYYYLYIPHNIKVIQISTKLSSNKSPGIPPLDSFWQPRNCAIDFLLAEIQWFWHIQKRRLKGIGEKIAFIGRGSQHFQKKYAIKYHNNKMKAFTDKASFTSCLDNRYLSIILSSFALEFPWKKLDKNKFYIHFSNSRNENDLQTDEYQQILEKCLLKKRTKDTPIVYVSLGTLSSSYINRSIVFLKKVTNVLQALPSLQVIISTGGIQIENSGNTRHLYWLAKVPQLDLLSHCDLMITHGGFNSIKECIEAGVPMIVYPLNIHGDQPGNATRISSHKIGLRGRIEDTELSIKNKILTILNNPMYRLNCQKMQKKN